ncbi:MAG TPA: ATP-binding cassette domain-containing protein [Thermoanaerobaculia bacterium]|nr:ATP-binding cassette domain-containing protein [Thermoanaerobaculia bacterium]
MSAHLRFTGLSRRFGRRWVLQRVGGEVATGGVLLVHGRNGSGKSTLLRCLAGLSGLDAGEIHYQENGSPLDPEARRRAIGYVAPDLTFYEPLTIEENLTFFARLRGLPGDTARSAVARIGLDPGAYFGVLSSGMRQRVRWAWALLARPRLLLLDEPFQNLDPPGEALARELLAEHLEGGLAVVASPISVELPRVTGVIELAG